MLRVGLTGGLASGKSTVAARLAEHGIAVLEADAIV
ncbi:MAG TPA: dephospho-CoA kinase, partial [Thermoanaerobaculia bacterium]|nr:dephospho-CoA kinase [Thermoanaerobaculia bacterium]